MTHPADESCKQRKRWWIGRVRCGSTFPEINPRRKLGQRKLAIAMNPQTTAYLFILLGMLLNAVALGLCWRLSRQMPGTGAWFLGATFMFVSLIPLVANLVYPWLPLVSLHNAGVAVGQAITVAGACRFFGKKPAWPAMIAIIAGFLLLHTWYLYVDYDAVVRTIVASAALAMLNAFGVWRLIAEPWGRERAARFFALAGWGAIVIAFALRAGLSIAYSASLSASTTNFENTIVYLLTFIVTPIASTATTLGLIMMTVQRLANEREEALFEARKAAEHFQELASYDSLTQACNRRFFLIRAGEELNKCRRRSQPFCLLLIDLDHFKQINDSYGHASGDEALRYAAHCVRTALRDFDVFGRLGGEEFAVVLSGVEYEQAIRVCNRLRETIAAGTIRHDDNSFAMTMSGGVVTASEGDDIHALLKAADVALYQAKSSGRNRIEPQLADVRS